MVTVRDISAMDEVARFDSEDNGSCRVYYKRAGKLYCWQIENYRQKTFSLLICTRDGEPSHAITGSVEPWRVLCPGETLIGRELNAWLALCPGTQQGDA